MEVSTYEAEVLFKPRYESSYAFELLNNMFSVLADFQAIKSEQDDHKIGIEGVGGNGYNFLFKGVSLYRFVFDGAFISNGEFVIDIFSGDVHESVIDCIFFGADVFIGDVVDMFFNIAEEVFSQSFDFGVVLRAKHGLEAFEGEFGIDGDVKVGEVNHGVDDFASAIAVLGGIEFRWEDLS